MADPDQNPRHDLDAPAPPGGPLRQDAPTADVTPGPVASPTTRDGDEPVEPSGSETPPEGPPEPSVEPSSTPEGPQVIPTPSTPEGEPGPDPERAEQVENAATSMDEPSDNSGAE